MITAIINLIIWLLIVGILIWLVQWVVAYVPVPEPFGRIAVVAVMILSAIVIISVLLQMVGVSTGIDVPKIAPSG